MQKDEEQTKEAFLEYDIKEEKNHIINPGLMIELLNRYCLDNKNNTGLLLLDMPTGTGKTYNVLRFIKEYLKQNHEKKQLSY